MIRHGILDYKIELPVVITEPPTGYVAWWKFDGSLNEETGNYPGTPYNSPTYVTGKNGQAMYFVPSLSQYVITTLPRNDIVLGQKEFTFGCWVCTSIGTNTRAYTMCACSDLGEIAMGFETTSRFVVNRRGGTTSFTQRTDASLRNGNWHMTYARYGSNDSSTGGPILDLWIDNSSYTSTYSFGDASVSSLTTTFYFGRLGTYNGLYFDGKIDSAMVYNRRLTDTEMLQLWNNGNGI